MKIVIRAGGVGSRLWPMSRINNPKQFQKVIGDTTMVRATYERVAPLIKDPSDLYFSINSAFRDKLRSEVPELLEQNMIVEPDTRNTGPAICLEVCYLEKYCQETDVIASLPSDDFISDDRAFQSLLLTTEEFLIENPNYILTPAIKPDYPDTGYTYFKAGKNLQKSGEETIYSVAKVVEKPSFDFCQDLIKTGIYYCHTGMYVWQLKHIRNLFKEHQAAMYEICQKIVELMDEKSSKNETKIAELYFQLEKVSIETAITDKAGKLAMSVSNRIGWSDLGKWHVVKRVLQKEENENLTKGKILVADSTNNLIYSTNPDKIVAVNDIDGLVIIDTEDALFISSLKKSADVKKIVEKIKEKGEKKYL